MTSLAREIRQATPAFYMPISSLNGVIFQYNPTAGAQTFSTATWADGWVSTTGGPRGSGPSRYISSINSSGAGILRDIGKQVISAGRVFRKVQLMVRQSGSTSTFGVEGNSAAPAQPNVDYLTGYIEFGFDGIGLPTPVGQFGRL
jgi:hypothetical protein